MDIPKRGISETILGKDPLHIQDLPLRRVPDYMRKKGGFLYWTGALVSIAFIYQVITGLLLLLYYNPANAYATTETIINEVPFGSLLLTTHLYGAYAMIALVYIHMFRNYFMGAYKKPRQLQWITGVILLLLTVGVGYFGYSMTGDVLSVDATDVGRGIALSVPVIGPWLENVFFGNGTTTGLFIRMLGWHIILAALVGLLFGFHFFMAEANGMMPSNKESKYRAPAIDEEKPTYKPWSPYNLAFTVQLALMTFGIIILIPSVVALLPNVPALFSPFPQVSPSSSLASFVPPYPPWFLLFVYKAVDFEMFTAFGGLEALAATITFAVIPLIYFIIIPFIDNSNDLHPLARPVVTAFGILGIIYLVILSLWGALAPGVEIPGWETAAVVVPPFVLVVGGMLALGRLYKKGRLRVGARSMLASFIIFAMIMSVGIFEFAQNFSAFLAHSDGLNLVSSIFTGGVTVFAAVGTMKSADVSQKIEMAMGETVKKPKNVHYMSQNTAIALTSIIAIAMIAIAYVISGLNPTYVPNESEFGIGLGVLLILAGIVLRIYRAANYHE